MRARANPLINGADNGQPIRLHKYLVPKPPRHENIPTTTPDTDLMGIRGQLRFVPLDFCITTAPEEVAMTELFSELA